MKLSGHTILVTGGSAGIGLAFARKFVELGNEVIITGRSQARLDEARALEPRLHALRSDVADPADVQALADTVRDRFPKLDVLVNNAGVFVPRNLRDGTADLHDLTAEIDTNLSGTVRMVSAFVDQIVANRGTLVTMTSGVAYVPLTAAPIYSATKAALHAYTVSLRFQLRDAGVHVVELLPPAVETETAIIPESVPRISTDALVAATLPALERGDEEIRIGQSTQLFWMSRFAPAFINGKLFEASKYLIPARKAS